MDAFLVRCDNLGVYTTACVNDDTPGDMKTVLQCKLAFIRRWYWWGIVVFNNGSIGRTTPWEPVDWSPLPSLTERIHCFLARLMIKSNCNWDYALLRKHADRGRNYPIIEVNKAREKKFNDEKSLWRLSINLIYLSWDTMCYRFFCCIFGTYE